MKDLFSVTAENAIKDMEITKKLYLTKNGEFYSTITNEYLNKMSEYEQFLSEEKVADWQKEIRRVILWAGEKDSQLLIDALRCYENAGEIMKKLVEFSSDNYCEELVNDFYGLGRDLPITCYIVTKFSPFAIEFIDEVVDEKVLEVCKDAKREYERKKNEQNAPKTQITTDSEKKLK